MPDLWPQTVELRELTVADVGGGSVALGNVVEREYELPDGRRRRGPAAPVVLPAGPRPVVGEGSRVVIGDATWEVVAVREGAPARTAGLNATPPAPALGTMTLALCRDAEPVERAAGHRDAGFAEIARAVARDDLAAVRAYLATGGDPNRCDDQGETLLHVAARHRRPAVVGALLEAGASPGARDRHGARPLDVAVAAVPAADPPAGDAAAGQWIVRVLEEAQRVVRALGDVVRQAGPAPPSRAADAAGPPADPSLLPELDGDALRFVWDVDPGRPRVVVSHAGRALWSQPLAVEDAEAFAAAARALRARYGVRVRDLEPTQESTRSLYGDSLAAAAAVDRVREALRRGGDVPSGHGPQADGGASVEESPGPAVRPADALPHLALEPLGAHRGAVSALALAPDGGALAAEHPRGVATVALSAAGIDRAVDLPGARLVGLPGADVVAVWRHDAGRAVLELVDRSTGALRHAFPLRVDDRVVATGMSPDGRLVAVLGVELVEEQYNSYLALSLGCWDVRVPELRWQRGRWDVGIEPRAGDRSLLAFDAAGDVLYDVRTGGDRSEVVVFSVQDGRRLHQTAVSERSKRAAGRVRLADPLVVGRGGVVIDATAAGTGLELLDPRGLGQLRIMAGDGRRIRPLAVSGDGRLALAAVLDAPSDEVQLWDLEARQPVAAARVPGDRVTCAAFDASARFALLGTGSGALVRCRWEPTGAGAEDPRRTGVEGGAAWS